jgi:hypothetical protein
MPAVDLLRKWRWGSVFLFFLALSAIAVLAFSFGHLPSMLSHAIEAFASPGELLWWSTLGGAFAGHPTGASGCALWIGGTAVCWTAVAALGTVLVKLLCRTFHTLFQQ